MTPDPNSLAARECREPIIEEFEVAWKGGGGPRIEDFLDREPADARGALFRDLLSVELAYRRLSREEPTAAEYAARFPALAAIVAELFDQTSAVVGPKSDESASNGRFRAGTKIADRYLIVRRLGRGGMGEVYQVEDIALDQTVALKFLPADRTEDAAWVEQLKREVMLARSVSHPNVCQVHDYQEAEGYSFLVMAFAAGGSLVTQANLRPFGRFAPEDVNAYARQLCDALAAVHDGGLLHRDLKPGNVLLDERGKVKLADFGLAAVAVQVRPEDAEQGTWQYMAPEQLDGNIPTERTDLYSLGLILYELVTGRRPFPAGTRDELRDQQRTAAVRPSELVKGLDPAFDRAILWCLERDSRNRPATARDVRDALPPLTPAKTADQGGTGKLRPRIALALLGATLAGLLVHAALADRTMAFHQLPPAQDANWLHGHAAALARSLDGADPLLDDKERIAKSSGFEWDLDLVKDAAYRRPAAWHPGPDERSPLVYFWYRSGPVYHTPANRVTPTDPPLTTPGMECVLLDLDGRLIEFHAVPRREARPPPEARARDEGRDRWERHLLGAAKLDPAQFRRVPAHHRPPVFVDDSWGLEEVGGTGKRVEFGVCDGSPVYFRVGEPFTGGTGRRDRTGGENVDVQYQQRLSTGAFGTALLIFTLVGAGPLAYRNWRLGRADLSGAARVAVLFVAASLTGWVLAADHVASVSAERILLMNVIGVAGFWGAALFVFYLVVEPQMRRRWPERLSSWNRALGGRMSDPLVGRDVLVGVLAGVCAALPVKPMALLLGTYYLAAPVYAPYTPNVPPGVAFTLFAYTLARTTGTFIVLLLLGLLLRRERLAAVALVVILTFNAVESPVTYSREAWVTWVGTGVTVSLVVVVALRFGWLATLVTLFTAAVINIMPLTLVPQAWYAGTTVTTAAALVALAVYGFFVSLGGQRLFPEDL